MNKLLKDGITWVGKTDWEIRSFHGEELSTFSGTTYNSYLVRDEKTVLIDTAWTPYAWEFVENLKREIDLKKIDYIIANHAEMDHSGALPALMREIPGTPIICSENGVKSLKGHYHADWNFMPQKTGDRLNIGSRELVFIEARLLHWPDSMMCYLTGSNVLFSNDAFGQHYATETLFNDLADQCKLFEEAIKYYANILTPYSRLVEQKIKEVLSFNLPVDMICPSHGVVWRKDPIQIVDKYLEWSKDYQENQVTIIYDTMWNSTKKMAEAIGRGIAAAGKGLEVKIFSSSRNDKNEIITEVFKSKAVLVGSPTINRGILSSVAGLLEEMRGLGFKRKKAAAFGTYGWSGESVKMITEGLQRAGFEVAGEGPRALWQADESALQHCYEFGLEIARQL